MKFKNIKLICLREIRDQLRDRRTLFVIAVMPLLLYPAMGIGIMQMRMLFTEQPRTVVILGADHLPPPPLLDGDRFVSNWFELPQDAEKLHVITDRQPDDDPEEEIDLHAAVLLEQAQVIREKLREHERLTAEKERAEKSDDGEERSQVARLTDEIQAVKRELGTLFDNSEIQVLMIVPEGFREHVEEVNRHLAERSQGAEPLPDYQRPVIVQNSADEKSLIAANRVKEALRAWEQTILQQRLSLANLPESLPTPVNPSPVDLAESAQLSANLWSRLIPALLVVMAATGAFYPAVDLGAGEKERGTMETLLICPATRTEIVSGKFATVVLFSMATAILNLLSMGLTGSYMVSMAQVGPLADAGMISAPSWTALIWTLLLMVPISALFSALALALAMFARSTKEGQYYLVPLLAVAVGLTIFCMSPAVEITPFYSVMPVMNVALLLKGLLLSPANPVPLYLYAIPVLVTSVGYSLLGLWWAIEQFKREDVLFREAERFELGLWIRHLLRDKEPIPSFVEAGICFVLIMFLQFAAMKYMTQAILATAEGDRPRLMLQLQVIQQLVIIASPALFMAVLLTTSVKRTLRLRLPRWNMLAAAAVLPLALAPLSLELAASLRWFFPPLPPGAEEALKTMSDSAQPLWLILLAFALAPAVCEELAFRGFILSGFSHSGRIGLAVVLSSVTFGIMHMIPSQAFNAALLGLVLGLLAIRSQSLLPPVVFHFVYNGLEVVRGRWGSAVPTDGPLGWFVRIGEGGLRYQWPTLVIAAAVAIFVLRWLVQQRGVEAGSEATDSEGAASDYASGPSAPEKSSLGVR